MKIIMLFIIIILFSVSAYAKSEYASSDAKSVVGYGYNNGTLVAIKVSSDGTLQIN